MTDQASMGRGKAGADGNERVPPKKAGEHWLIWLAELALAAGTVASVGAAFFLGDETLGLFAVLGFALLQLSRLARVAEKLNFALSGPPVVAAISDEQARRDRIRELRGQLIAALGLLQKLTAQGIWDEAKPLQRLVAELERELQEAAGKPKPLSGDERFYFGSIYCSLRGLRKMEAEQSEMVTLQGEALSDNLEWLDCWLERRGLKTEELGR